MEQLEQLLKSMKDSNITLDHQSMEVRKQMAEIMPRLVSIQEQVILERQDLKKLTADLLSHAKSLLLLTTILVHESELGESPCHTKNLS